jgi:hypothetical protein
LALLACELCAENETVNNHPSKLLEDALEAAYRDHARQLINVAIENYMLGQNEADIVRRMQVGLQRLHEAHVLLQKELKQDNE